MDQKDCDEVYKLLEGMIHHLSIGWILEQVAEQIHLGKTVEKEIDTLKEDRVADLRLLPIEHYQSRLKKGPKATFPVTVEYEPRERLTMLIDAIEQAIVNTANMEDHLFSYFKMESDKWAGRIEFCSEEPNRVPLSICVESNSPRLASSRKLKELLDSLRKEIIGS